MNRYIFITSILLLFFGCRDKPTVEQSKMSSLKTPTLSVRNAHAMVYHSEEARPYLFGGADEKEIRSDLWVLDSITWQKVHTEMTPQARTFGAMTFDLDSSRILLFGGSRVLFGRKPNPNNLLNDTWQFKHHAWEKISTPHAPSSRAEAIMVYDEHRNRVVLFGGYKIENKDYIKLGDTWEFYNNNWHLASNSGPSPRHGVSMVYDADRKSVVLFGGSTVDKQYGVASGETWIWTNNTWQKLKTEQPAGIFNASVMYDKDQKEHIRFGGWNGKSRIDQTWSLQNNTWKQLDINSHPTPRNHSAMVYDDKRKTGILFGGHDGTHIFGDTWVYKDQTWTKILDNQPLKRIKNGH